MGIYTKRPGHDFVVRCPIHGPIPFNKREKDLIDSICFQRLRHISQLGFVSWVYPGATHNRFAHSLGVMYLAGAIFDQLTHAGNWPLTDFYSKNELKYYRQTIRFAALIHDLGHPPFSHSAECLLPKLSEINLEGIAPEDRRADHEDFSIAFAFYLTAGKSPILSEEEAGDIAALLSEKREYTQRLKPVSGKPDIFPLLCQIISGEIDADRMDYLLRDSHFAGVSYGRFDLSRIINSLSCYYDQEHNRQLLSLNGQAIPAYEYFLLARYHMFVQVYFHKTIGSFEYYLAKIFEENEIDLKITGDLEEYIHLTENLLFKKINSAAHKKWSKKISERIAAKNILRIIGFEKQDLFNKVKKLLEEEKIEVIHSRSTNKFTLQKKNSLITGKTLMINQKELGETVHMAVGSLSPLLKWPDEKIEINQLYVHKEDYQHTIDKIQKFRLSSLF